MALFLCGQVQALDELVVGGAVRERRVGIGPISSGGVTLCPRSVGVFTAYPFYGRVLA